MPATVLELRPAGKSDASPWISCGPLTPPRSRAQARWAADTVDALARHPPGRLHTLFRFLVRIRSACLLPPPVRLAPHGRPVALLERQYGYGGPSAASSTTLLARSSRSYAPSVSRTSPERIDVRKSISTDRASTKPGAVRSLRRNSTGSSSGASLALW